VRDDLVERFRRGDRQALSRLLTHAAHGDFSATLPLRKEASKDQGRIVAFTGSGGVGKSTLVGKLIEVARGHGQTVAVLACDPQSPLSGGALLGDRFRMPSRPDDDGVFIRSIATAGDRGAVAQHVGAMARLLQAFGFDFVFLETAGAGQGDTAVRAVADVVVLLLQPETGDDLQWEKAGLLEVADIIVVHKADLPGSSNVEAQVNAAFQLGGRESPRVVRASARTGEGLERLWQLISEFPRRAPFPTRDHELLRLAQENLAARFAAAEAAGDPRLKDLLAEWQERRLPQREAAAMLLELLLTTDGSPRVAP
jgi:LAO/AO transport system ATPase